MNQEAISGYVQKSSSVKEGVIFVAQDGVISTKAYKARVLKRQIEQDCCVCEKHPVMLGHVLPACENARNHGGRCTKRDTIGSYISWC